MPILIALVLLVGSGLLGVAVGFPMLVPALMVIATTIWVHSDSERIDYPDGAVEAKVLLLWIIFFPHYLYKRREVLIANTVSQRIAEQKGTAMNSNTAATALSPGAAPNAERAERACPECGESVLAVARKCKHCGSAIEPVASDDVPQAAVAASPMPLGASLGRGSSVQDEKEDKGSRKAFVGIAVVVVALGALLWFASSYEGDTSSDAATASSEQAPAHAVGDLITTSKLAIRVTSVDMPDGVGIPLMRETPAEGGRYVAVQWEYENISPKPLGVFSQPRLYLADPAGTRYEADIGASSTYAMQLDLTEKVMSDLNPGIKVRSASVFEVAESLLNQPGWTIVIRADETVKMPLFGEPEPVAAMPSETPAVEEPVVPEETTTAEAPALPEFGAYEAAIYDGDLNPADWMTVSEAGEWSDQIGKPMDEPEVNFAGKYYIGLHSCGTGCSYYSMTDLSTGQSLNELVASFAAGEERPTTADGREYLTQLVGQADSRLLIAQYHIGTVTEPTNECREQAFVLEDETLTAITDVRQGCTAL